MPTLKTGSSARLRAWVGRAYHCAVSSAFRVGSPVSAAFKVEQDDPALTAECEEDISYS